MEAEKKKGFDSFTLKLIAIITMFIDHTTAVFLERYMAKNTEFFTEQQSNLFQALDIVLRGIGRVAFPIFIFLLVQGFMHTRNKLKYAIRLGIFAIVSEIPFNFAFSNSLWDSTHQNVFVTLFLGFLFMCFADFIFKKELKPWLGYIGIVLGSILSGIYVGSIIVSIMAVFGLAPVGLVTLITILLTIVAVVVLMLVFCLKKSFNFLAQTGYTLFVLFALVMAADFLYTDYGGMGVLAIGVAYVFRNNYKKCFGFTFIPLFLASILEAIGLYGLFFVGKYNGEKGKSNMKYFFYFFYPVHLGLLALIAHFVGL